MSQDLNYRLPLWGGRSTRFVQKAFIDGVVGMEQTYSGHGVCFRYPTGWNLSVQEQEQQTAILVDSPQTAFWILTLFFDLPRAEQVVEAAVGTFQDEYGEIDVYPSTAQLCQQAALALDLDFVCVETITSAFLRAFQTDRFTGLVLFQAIDHELESLRPLLERIGGSLVYNNAAADARR